MGLQIRDDRQIKALTGLSQVQFDHLLPFFSAIYEATRQKTYWTLAFFAVLRWCTQKTLQDGKSIAQFGCLLAGRL